MSGSALRHVLHPGDVACGARGERMETLLGSCVAIVLTDPRRTVGAMCHIVHASTAPRGQGAVAAAYADAAVDRLFALLQRRAIAGRQCEAWVYGGGNMFPSLVEGASHVGRRNVQAVLSRLDAEGVAVTRCDVGGSTYRRLAWTVGAGAPECTAVEIEDGVQA